MQSQSHPASGAPIVLPYTFETYGVVLDFLSRQREFEAMSFGIICAAVRLQLRHRFHFITRDGAKLTGYLGWLPTTIELAEAWRVGSASLTPVLDGPTDAAALTIVAADSTAVTRGLIRAARNANPGKRAYFQRVSTDGSSRKNSVANRPSS